MSKITGSQGKRILLLSAYDAGSHRRWREQLAGHLNEHSWTVLTLPPRNFAWRSRGNALSWALGSPDILTREYDLVLATSMTDLSALKGMAPSLAALPSTVYFHENQFAYPERLERKEGQNYMITNLYTALAADLIVFNSLFNRDSFLDGAARLLAMLPDCVPDGVIPQIEDRSEVIPVPLESYCYIPRPPPPEGSPLTILWNHRWEHDKAPDRFFKALYEVSQRGGNFRLNVLGQRFRDCPEIFQEARDRLADHINIWGFVEDVAEYRKVIHQNDVVVSTSLHEFQGVALLEAVASGCVPLVPDRLAYVEYIPENFRFRSFLNEPAVEIAELADRLMLMVRNPKAVREEKIPDLNYLSWNHLADRYREVIDRTTGSEPEGQLPGGKIGERTL